MSNRIKRHQERQNEKKHGHPLWVKVVLIIIVAVFIIGMIMIGF